MESRKGVWAGEDVDQGSHTLAFTLGTLRPAFMINVPSRLHKIHVQSWLPLGSLHLPVALTSQQ